MAIPIPEQTRALYAELVDRLAAEQARRTVGKAPGTFTTKSVSGEDYVYFQFSEPGGRYRQVYLGRKGDALDRLVARFKAERVEAENERADAERLTAQILAGGGWSMGAGSARVLKAFGDAGVFEAGAVLVGTHAFGVIGNMLGVHWSGANPRTHDLNLAAVSMVAAPDRPAAGAPGALERLKMGFLPVPALDPRKPSTSFKVRGQALRVDFLTPGKDAGIIALPSLGTAGQGLPYMDYLLEAPEKAAVLDAGGVLVLVPAPARFALHKILVAKERPASEQTKAAKDLAQAAELIVELGAARPGDLRLAAARIAANGWRARLSRGLRQLLSAHPQAHDAARRISQELER